LAGKINELAGREAEKGQGLKAGPEGQMAWDAKKRAQEFGNAYLAEAFSSIRDEALEEAALMVEADTHNVAGVTTKRGFALAATIRAQKRKICPRCGRPFRGNGWDGINAHWKANHLDVMSYEEAWDLIQNEDFESIRNAAASQ
jgi:hypothetical protein